MAFHEEARDLVRNLFEAQVANFRVLDMLRLHDIEVDKAALKAREGLEDLQIEDSAKTRIARQIAQTFVRPVTPGDDGDIEDLAHRMFMKTQELAGLAKLNLPERDFTGLTIRRDLSARSRESMLVTLWSDFEAFVFELFGLLASVQPAPLVPKDKTVKLEDLLERGSIEALTQHLVQEAIEAVFRKSFDDWITELCHKFSLSIPHIEDDLRESYFRRNVVVHTGAVASSLYLSKIAPLDVPKPEEGSRLSVDRDYLIAVADKLASLAFTLAIGAVSKYDMHRLDEAEAEFTNLCYILLIEKRPGAVLIIGQNFRDTRFKTQSAKEIIRVNYWLACRDLGKLDQHAAEIEEWDVGALDDNFRLAKMILTGNLESALAEAKRRRESGSLQERFWKTWPLFRELRAMERGG